MAGGGRSIVITIIQRLPWEAKVVVVVLGANLAENLRTLF